MNAKQQTYSGEKAWEVVVGANKVFVGSGKNILNLTTLFPDILSNQL